MNAHAYERLYSAVVAAGEARRKSDFVYIFAQTSDNIGSIETAVLETGTSEDGVPIGVCGRGRSSGFSGFDRWRDALSLADVPPGRIHAVDRSNSDPLNTLSEAASLVRHARDLYVDVAVVAPRWHILRCYASVVTYAIKFRSQAVFHPWIGGRFDWDQRVRHSQGVQVAKRCDLMVHEVLKVLRYTEDGHLYPADEVHGYMLKKGVVAGA